MSAYKKRILDPYELQVIPARSESFSYFLRNSETLATDERLDFRWVKNSKTIASITFALSEDSDAVSLPQSPFGGIWLDSALSSAGLDSFIGAMLEELSRREIRTVRIIQPPKPYEPNSDLINYLLFKNGFVQDTVLSHHFFAGKKKIKNFVKKEQVRFKSQVMKAGLTCDAAAIKNFGFLQDIRNWNQKRGYEVNFDDHRIVSQVSSFPERYFLVSVSNNGEPIAHTLCVKLLPDSFYYFLAAINPQSSLKNIGELCLFQLFQLAADDNANFIDLGSSDTETGANHGLMFFKSRFSNDISNKIGWKLQL